MIFHRTNKKHFSHLNKKKHLNCNNIKDTKFIYTKYGDLLLLTGVLIIIIGLCLPWLDIGGFPSGSGFELIPYQNVHNTWKIREALNDEFLDSWSHAIQRQVQLRQ